MRFYTDEFLDVFKKFENKLKEQYKLPKKMNISDIINDTSNSDLMEIINPVRSEIQYIIEVRNLLQHNVKLQDSYAINPTKAMMDLLESTIHKIENPAKAIDSAIPFNKIFKRDVSDSVLKTMKIMQEKTFTHIPVFKHDELVGVFSESTIFDYLINDNIVLIDENLTFADSSIAEYIKLDNHKMETFRFVKTSILLKDVKKIFDEALLNNDRIGLVFLTTSGKMNDNIDGIITAWDVAGKSSY